MDLRGLECVAADDLHVGIVLLERSNEVTVELDTQIRFVVRHYALKIFSDRSGTDSQLQDHIVRIGSHACDHPPRKLRGAWRYRPDRTGIFQKSLKELNIFVH